MVQLIVEGVIILEDTEEVVNERLQELKSFNPDLTYVKRWISSDDTDLRGLLKFVLEDISLSQSPAHAFKLLLIHGLTLEQAKRIYNPGQVHIDKAIELLKIKYNGLYL